MSLILTFINTKDIELKFISVKKKHDFVIMLLSFLIFLLT